MRRTLFILSCLLTLCLCAGNQYTDDIYYYPSLHTTDTVSTTPKPYYNTKKMKELVFIDTLSIEGTDTIQAPISARLSTTD